MNNFALDACVFGAEISVIQVNGVALDAKAAQTAVSDGAVVGIKVAFAAIFQCVVLAFGHIKFVAGARGLPAEFISGAELGLSLAAHAQLGAVIAVADLAAVLATAAIPIVTERAKVHRNAGHTGVRVAAARGALLCIWKHNRHAFADPIHRAHIVLGTRIGVVAWVTCFTGNGLLVPGGITAGGGH
jgi:hypothetical protein